MVLGIGTDRRFFPAVRELLRLTKSGELGKILHTEAHFSNKVAGTLSEWRLMRGFAVAQGQMNCKIHSQMVGKQDFRGDQRNNMA